MLIVCTARDGGDNAHSDYASGEISGGFGGTGRSHGFGVRDLVAVAGIVAGFGVSCAHLSFFQSLSVCWFSLLRSIDTGGLNGLVRAAAERSGDGQARAVRSSSHS